MNYTSDQITSQADGEENSFGQSETVNMLRAYALMQDYMSSSLDRKFPALKDLGESPEEMFLDDDQDAAWVDGWNMCLMKIIKASKT